ncbi:MAG: hypothetical protein V1914_02215 [archaeon]
MNIKNLLATSLTALVLAGCVHCKNDVESKRLSTIVKSQKIELENIEIEVLDSVEKAGKIKAKILEEAAKNQVVMFGEVHDVYKKDNDFVISILPDLKNQGFDYMAVEIPVNLPDVSYLNALVDYIEGRIRMEEIQDENLFKLNLYVTGWLDVIAASKKLDMKVVRYDMAWINNKPEITNIREKIAFNNLKELIFLRDPNARIVVYCGALHTNKKPSSIELTRDEQKILGAIDFDKITWLGNYLNEYTKGRNFTVSFAENTGAIMPYVDLRIQFKEY